MSFRQLVIGIAFLAIFAMALRISIDTDTWWQLRAGQTIVEPRSIPKTDSFSYTKSGSEWLYPSSAWLSEVQMYLLYTLGKSSDLSLGLLNLWTAALATLAFAFIYLSLTGGVLLRAATLVLAGATAAIYWAARPYMMSFVLTAVFLWILEDYRWGRKNRLVWLPILMIIWVNSHPGFAIGFILLGIYFLDAGITWFGSLWKSKRRIAISRKDWGNAGRKLRPFVYCGIAMLAAICINPSGALLLRYPFETVSIGVLRDFIQEWQSPDFHLGATQPFIWLWLLTFCALAISRRPVVASDLLLVGVFSYMSLLAGRNIALFALAAPIVLTRFASPLITDGLKKIKLPKSKPVKWNRQINLAILTLATLAIGLKATLVVPIEPNLRAIEKTMPNGAIDALRDQRPEGNLFNSYNWGGYLVWQLPEYPVFVDGRTDLYGDEFLKSWLNIVSAEPGWQAELERRGVRLVLLEPSWPLSKVLAYEGWHLLYQDDISVLYER